MFLVARGDAGHVVRVDGSLLGRKMVCVQRLVYLLAGRGAGVGLAATRPESYSSVQVMPGVCREGGNHGRRHAAAGMAGELACNHEAAKWGGRRERFIIMAGNTEARVRRKDRDEQEHFPCLATGAR